MPEDVSIYLSAVEERLQQLLCTPEPAVEQLYGMMRYHMGWADASLRPTRSAGGKRIRPLLCLLSCEAVGGRWQNALPLACGLELVHNFSLIHDDVEDASAFRRHRPTVWSVWGVPQATNTGDAMFSLAHLSVHGLTAEGLDAEVVLAVLRRVEEACLALCEGQCLDIAFETAREVTVTAYKRMIAGKTAALLACAADTGALVGSGLNGPHEQLAVFGREMGLAFQMVDDLLGIWGSSSVTGKPEADDLRNQKKTLPVLFAMQTMAARADGRLAHLMAQPALDEEQVAEAIRLVEATGARERVIALAQEHTEQALQALDQAVVPSQARDTLRELALALVERDR
ncbi:MAG: polyprenyl synthetase family protein [Anaerolineae bacterium]